MKKFLTTTTLAFTLALALPFSAVADFKGADQSVAMHGGFKGHDQSAVINGGFKGPGVEPTTVQQALTYGDDTPVVLTGKIERSLGDEKYIFTDKTGKVTVDIDNDDWHGLTVTPNDTIVIEGEIDKDFFKTQIDVERVRLK